MSFNVTITAATPVELSAKIAGLAAMFGARTTTEAAQVLAQAPVAPAPAGKRPGRPPKNPEVPPAVVAGGAPAAKADAPAPVGATPPPPKGPADPSRPTKKETMDLLVAVMNKMKGDQTPIQAKLLELTGSKNFSGIPEDKYGVVAAWCQEALA